MIDLKDRKPRDLFVDEDGDYWLVLEHGQWLHFGPNGYARVAFAGPDSYSPHLATAEEIKAFCERLMPSVPAPNPFDGWTVQQYDEMTFCAIDAKDNDEETVGLLHGEGWLAWVPSEDEPFAQGTETDQAGRDAVVAALRSKGAKL